MTDREAVHRLLTTWAPLTAIVGDRIFPSWATDAELPYVTITRISKPRVRTLSGATGLSSPRFQVDVWARTQSECDAITDAIYSPANDRTGPQIQCVYFDDQQDLPEPSQSSGSPLFRQSIDLIVWFEDNA